MTRDETAQRMRHLEDLGDKNGLILLAVMDPGLKRTFTAGTIGIEPDPASVQLVDDVDFRIWYTSTDGERRRDVTDMKSEEFVDFMRSEPQAVRRRGP